MFQRFFTELRHAKVPVSLKEYLVLLEALEKDVIPPLVDDFYYLSRATLVKDERTSTASTRCSATSQGRGVHAGGHRRDDPRGVAAGADREISHREEKQQIEALGGWDKLMETLQKRLEEQKERHEGGNKWIGSGGTSPFGNSGYNPEGVAHRPGQGPPRQGGEGLGQARVQESRRPGRARHAQPEGRDAAPAQMGA